jgi:nucleoside phosphorylase
MLLCPPSMRDRRSALLYARIKIKQSITYFPKVIGGEIASGEKVVDDPTNDFFIEVLNRWPKVRAVEMEGAGVGSAIENAQSFGIPVSFIMIRGISDLPRHEDRIGTRGTVERDSWKAYASETVAAFTIGWITDGLPIAPSARFS